MTFSLDLLTAPKRILFEDEFMIAIDKPSDLPSQATPDPNREHAELAVFRYLTAKQSGLITLYEMHRLDLETSGVLLFSKHRDANRSLTDQFRDHKIKKVYWALTSLSTKTEWQIKNHLAPSKAQKNRMTAVHSGGQRAETEFKVLSRSPRAQLLEARPRTGRRHQIRVHLEESKSPILGDLIYGTETTLGMAPRQMLHAKSLELSHPITGERIQLEAGLPEDFQQCARELEVKIDF